MNGKELISKNGARNVESPPQLSQGQLAILAPAVRPSDFLHWTLQARGLLLQYWKSGNPKHLRAFCLHLIAMRARAQEAKR